MALTQSDIVIDVAINPRSNPFKFGVVITAGANPVIAWDSLATITYTGLAAPPNVTEVAAPSSPADITTWMGKKVAPLPAAFPNPNGNFVGMVTNVILIGDPPTVLSLVVKTDSGLYLLLVASGAVLVPNQ